MARRPRECSHDRSAGLKHRGHPPAVGCGLDTEHPRGYRETPLPQCGGFVAFTIMIRAHPVR